jgi:hypothetical protein
MLLERVKNSDHFSYLGTDLSFLEKLPSENLRVRKIFDQMEQPNDTWKREVEDVQPWVQKLYEKLAGVFGLIVNPETRRGGEKGECYADHYLTHIRWSLSCDSSCTKIDFEKCWAFETKGKSQPPARNTAIIQCHSADLDGLTAYRLCRLDAILTTMRVMKASWRSPTNPWFGVRRPLGVFIRAFQWAIGQGAARGSRCAF